MQLLGCEKGESLFQIEPHLVAKSAERPRSGSVRLLHPVTEHMFEELQIGLHSMIVASEELRGNN